MAQPLRTLAALPGDPVLLLSTNILSHIYSLSARRLNTFSCLCEYQAYIWYTCRQSTPSQSKQTNKCIYRRSIARLQPQIPSSQLASSFNMAQFLKQPHHFKQHYQLKKNYSNSCACWEKFIFEAKQKLNFLLLYLPFCGWKGKKGSSIVLSFAREVIE